MPEGFKPQLLYRSNPDTSRLPYPVLISPKLDGIRCPIYRGRPVSRTLKEPPNRFLRKSLTHELLSGMDGEIIVGEPNAHDVFNRTDTFWKRHDMVTPFNYYAFDDFSRPDWKYYDRYRKLSDRIRSLDQNLEGVRVHLLAHSWVNSEQELLEEEERILLLGYEGVIIRCPNGPYKFNRTTEREQNAFKLKRFIDSEARIIGFVEELHNANEALVNELGRTKRQTLQENMIPKGTLGSFIVQDVQENDASHKFYGVTFNIGSGFDAADRILYWNDREKYYGKLVTYKYFAPGSKDAPRHPIFKGIRDESDMLQ